MGIDEASSPNPPEREQIWLEFPEPGRVTIQTPNGRWSTSNSNWREVSESAQSPAAPLDELLRTGRAVVAEPKTTARDTADTALHSGRKVPHEIGHYRVLGRLGGGGFGDVYETLDLERREVVALKVLSSPSPVADVGFKAEVRIVADLAHPNLLTPYELLESAGRLAFTMRLVHGVDFVRAMRRGLDQGWTEAHEKRLLSALAQLHSAIGALHGQGILHLDIKPSNVLVDTSGHLVLLDFGLSQRRSSHAQAPGIAGTPAYLAPEQLLDGTASQASDWYAVGVMLFETLTGTLPFPDPASAGFFASTFADAPSAASLVPDVPPVLEAFARRCSSAIRRAERPRTMSLGCSRVRPNLPARSSHSSADIPSSRGCTPAGASAPEHASSSSAGRREWARAPCSRCSRASREPTRTRRWCSRVVVSSVNPSLTRVSIRSSMT